MHSDTVGGQFLPKGCPCFGEERGARQLTCLLGACLLILCHEGFQIPVYTYERGWMWDCRCSYCQHGCGEGQPADLLMKDAERGYKTCGSCARVEHNTVGVPCWCHSLFNLNNCSSKGQLQSSWWAVTPSASHPAHSHPCMTYLMALNLIPTVFLFRNCTHCYVVGFIPSLIVTPRRLMIMF